MSKNKTWKLSEISFSLDCFADDSENYYLLNVRDNYPRLKDVYEGKISYIPSDYPLLVNTFEQLYKGVVKELQKMYPSDIKFAESTYTAGHKFSHFAYTVANYIPISTTKEGFKVIKQSLEKIEGSYNGARYADRMTKECFLEDFRKLNKGLYRLIEGLRTEYQKSMISEEEEKELAEW